MDKSDFLNKISKMTRKEIEIYLSKNCKRKKIIYPVLILKPKIYEEYLKSNKNK